MRLFWKWRADVWAKRAAKKHADAARCLEKVAFCRQRAGLPSGLTS